jgi:hypothetical protein
MGEAPYGPVQRVKSLQNDQSGIRR